jgi:hypothetical protein
LATAYGFSDATGERVVEDGPDGRWSRPPEAVDPLDRPILYCLGSPCLFGIVERRDFGVRDTF